MTPHHTCFSHTFLITHVSGALSRPCKDAQPRSFCQLFCRQHLCHLPTICRNVWQNLRRTVMLNAVNFAPLSISLQGRLHTEASANNPPGTARIAGYRSICLHLPRFCQYRSNCHRFARCSMNPLHKRSCQHFGERHMQTITDTFPTEKRQLSKVMTVAGLEPARHSLECATNFLIRNWLFVLVYTARPPLIHHNESPGLNIWGFHVDVSVGTTSSIYRSHVKNLPLKGRSV